MEIDRIKINSIKRLIETLQKVKNYTAEMQLLNV